jgi:Metallo-peptidase family M12
MHRTLAGIFAVSVLAAACSTETVVHQGAPPVTSEPVTPEQPVEPVPPTPVPKKPTDPLIVDLGSVQTGVDVALEIPVGALGFNIVAEGEVGDFDPNKPFGIERITDPNGVVVHDNFTPNGGTKETSTAAFDTIAAASVPQSENVKQVVPPGKWKVRFGVQGNPTAKVALTVKVRVQSSGDGVFHGGTLDLTIHVPAGVVVDGSTVDPSKASTNAGIKERIDTFYKLTSQMLGIERGTVAFATAKSTLVDLDDNEIIDGFATSTGATDGTQNMHILLTNSIRQGGQPIAIGISPGIPGAATVFGRGVSGIIVVPGSGSDNDVLTMIHEMGHFIGLNHTTEFDGQSSDPLMDTPACPAGTISSNQLQNCPDNANIMFAAGAINGPVTLSPTQKRVYRGSPIYKALSSTAMKTQSLHAPSATPFAVHRTFRTSGRALSPVESELSSGFCGLTLPDAAGLVQRHGQAVAVAQLRAAAADADLAPFIRGRATLVLRTMGLQP